MISYRVYTVVTPFEYEPPLTESELTGVPQHQSSASLTIDMSEPNSQSRSSRNLILASPFHPKATKSNSHLPSARLYPTHPQHPIERPNSILRAKTPPRPDRPRPSLKAEGSAPLCDFRAHTPSFCSQPSFGATQVPKGIRSYARN